MCFEMAFLIQLFPIQLHDSDLTTLHAETQKEHYFLSSLIFMNYTDESEKNIMPMIVIQCNSGTATTKGYSG